LPVSRGRDEPSLFDPNRGELTIYARSGSKLTVTGQIAIPSAIGSFPVIGNWRSNLWRRLVFVDSGGVVHGWPKDSGTWPRLPANYEEGWPFRWPVEKRDALAFFARPSETAPTRLLHWVNQNGVSGIQDHATGDARIRPVVVGFDRRKELLFLTEEALDDETYLYMFRTFLDPNGQPSTVPLRFPNDPPPGG
jgi:hypothetical protein